MELLFKAYSDRSSRLGIEYKYPYQAVKSYELLLSKGACQNFHLKMEIIRVTVKLTLTSEQNGFSSIYKDVEFKQEQMKSLIRQVQQKKAIQFVHVYKTGNLPFVARPFEQEKFITLTDTEIISSGNFEGLI